ncbi:MAG: hypothetical protein VYA51_12705 [Planctomycetota bacterium]|nr:hypothetical protein [Planctomycetota bacterium]
MPRIKYNQVPSQYAEGQAIGPRDSKPFTLPALPQITTFTLTDATPAAGEAWVLTATDDETGQVHTLAITSGASLADSLDAAVAAVGNDGKFNDLFTATEDGASVLTLEAKHAGRAYTFVLDTSAGSATSGIANSQEPGGSKLAFGRLLAVSGEAEARELQSGDVLRDLAGVLFRTDFNHQRPYEPADQRSGYDGAERGDTVSLLIEGQVALTPESGAEPSALTDSVFVRIAGGTVGVVGASADGGNTVDISSIARWESLPNGDGLCRVRFDML